MRSTRFRLVAFTLIAAGLGVALLAVPRPAAAQKPIPVDPTQPGGKKEDGELLEKISFPENKQTNEQFRGLLDYSGAKEPNYVNLFRLAQLILDAKSDYFFQYADGEFKGQRRSVKEETNRIIGTLKKEGLDYYQLTYGPEADTQLKLAKENGYDRPRLADLAQRYYHTKAGAEAAILLAALYLEAGNYPEAAYGYRKLLARPDAEKMLDPGVLFRAAVALRRAGEGKQTDEVAAVWEKLEKKLPREGLVIGRKAYTLEQLKAELDRPVPTVFGGVGAEFVAMKGGDATRTAPAEAGVPFLSAEEKFQVMYNVGDGKTEIDAANTWLKGLIDRTYLANNSNKTKAALIPSFFPVTAPNMIVFRGYDGVYAIYTKAFKDANGKQHFAGELAWFTTAKWGATQIHQAGGGGDGSGVLTEDNKRQEEWYNSWNNPNSGLPSVMFENPLAGSLSHDGKRVYFVDDFNIPPPANAGQFDPFGGGGMPQAQGGKVEYNRLVAVDLESGMLSWTLGDLPAGERVDDDERLTAASQLAEGAYFLGPPVSVNGKLYVLLERDGAVKLACLDPQKEMPVAPRAGGKPGGKPRPAFARQPELVWVQNLGRVNTPVKQDSYRRIQGAFLASSDGVMICPTNSGAVVAVDLNARSLLWAHTYATLDPGPNTGNPGFPGGGIRQPNVIKDQRWRASAPMIAGGRVLLSAYDGGTLQCLDLRTGTLLWQENRRTDDLFVGGVIGDKVLVVGKSSVRAIKLVGEKDEKNPKRERATPAWENDLKIATPVGHGVVGKDGRYYLPVIGDADKPDDRTPAVIGVDMTTGKFASNTPYRRKDAGPQTADARLALGNLVFHDGLMYSQSATEVAVFQLNAVKRREVEETLAKNPNDPVGLFSRGELALERGELQAAIDDFKASEKNNPDEATAKKVKNKLYVAYTEVIRNDPDFTKAEKILDEYKGLCEFALPDPADVSYARAREEQIRRRGLYYNLLADGRERQGRLVDAFDAYRAYAELGEQNKLLPVPEDPNTLALSGVWAAGRIDNMMRKAKDAAARKPLEDKVATEWEAVKKANDLERLRNFVKVFGPYFAAGREAQYLLAVKLTETNEDANRREAQALLLSLVAQADDDRDAVNAARATDALARVLTDRGLTDDALGLYRRIADRYPNAQVRDGKTGSDLLSELIADKRYLPSLESDRTPAMGKYKATAEQPTNNWRQAGSSTSLVGGGDVLPFFNRHLVTLESADVYGNNPCNLVVTDRVTGEQKLKSNALPAQGNVYSPAAQQNPNGSLNNQRLTQISGHLMLLHLGTSVYCFDLSTGNKDPLWKVNLLGPNAQVPNPNQGGINYAQEIEPNGDMCVTPQIYNQFTGQQTSDWAYRVGKSMVLQANYATVLTKEGMVTKDPRTGTTLWQRAGVTQRSLVFGDARHVFLVEPTATGYASRVFRAVDGVQVAKVPDFGQLVMGNSRLHLLGRNLLLFEAPAKDKPKVLRLYDCLEGKDVWSREYPAESVAFDTLDPELCGVVSADGKIDLLATRTGKPLHQVGVDAKKVDEHVKDAKGKFNLVRPLLLADADRFYCFLNRDPKANPGGQMQPEQMYSYPSFNRARVVNGVAYAFDRGSGKRQWYQETEFVNQRLMVERFDDLPCLVAFNPAHTADPNNPGVGGFRGQPTAHKVVAVDKVNGSVRESKDLPQNGNGWMQGIKQTKDVWEIGGGNNTATLKIAPAK